MVHPGSWGWPGVLARDVVWWPRWQQRLPVCWARHEGRGFAGPGKRILVRGSPTQKKRARTCCRAVVPFRPIPAAASRMVFRRCGCVRCDRVSGCRHQRRIYHEVNTCFLNRFWRRLVTTLCSGRAMSLDEVGVEWSVFPDRDLVAGWSVRYIYCHLFVQALRAFISTSSRDRGASAFFPPIHR